MIHGRCQCSLRCVRRPLYADRVVLTLLLLASLSGCVALTDAVPYRLRADDDDTVDDDDSGDDDAGDDDDVTPCDTSWLVEGTTDVSFAFQIEPLLLTRCDPCHTVQDLGGLHMLSPNVWDSLVGAPNLLGYGADMPRVTAGDPEASYALHKLLGCAPQDAIWGYYGSYMPPPVGEAQPLSTDELLLIYTWILQGAPDN